jgi:chemotaxis protein CheD
VVETKDGKQIIGIADMKMAKGSGTLITYALGSCIGICLYDPLTKVGALIHIMLPLNMETGRTHPMKYADTGVRETLKMMESMGASRARITAKIAGGAKMFEISGGGSLGNVGQRNIESVHMVLKREGIRLLKEDVGGTVARTLSFDVSDGTGCVRSHGKPDLIL